MTVDELVVSTGFRPQLDFLREVRLSLDPAVECPPMLAPLIDPNLHSCGTVRPHGARELAQPDAGFYFAGIKSYGRAPTFLMLTGYEQVRSIVAEIAGDRAAADKVELVLPETGVCSRPVAVPSQADPSAAAASAGCCGGPPPVKTAGCCVADVEAKAAEIERLKAEARKEIADVEARANALNTKKGDNAPVVDWWEDAEALSLNGTLTRVDCLGKQMHLQVKEANGAVRVLLVVDHSGISVTGGEVKFACGVQKPRAVMVHYKPLKTPAAGIYGEVIGFEYK